MKTIRAPWHQIRKCHKKHLLDIVSSSVAVVSVGDIVVWTKKKKSITEDVTKKGSVINIMKYTNK